jgi:hypothetical protein
MTKEQLELKVKELTAALTQFETDQVALKDQLNKAKCDLEDINKIHDAVANSVGNYDFNNADHYEYDFEINYNNQIELSNIEFNYTSDLEESICGAIEDLFKIEGDD